MTTTTILALLAGCNLTDPQFERFNRSGIVDTGSTDADTDADSDTDSDSDADSDSDTDTHETGETGETGDSSDTSDTSDSADSGDSADTADSGDSGDSGETGIVDTGDTADTGETGVVDTSDTSADSGTVDTGDTGIIIVIVDSDSDGYAADVDCDDTDAAINPSAIEACDSVDNDCDGVSDESGATGESLWYDDADGDGYGNATLSVMACDAPVGYVASSTDCDDTSASIHLGASETCNSVDDDCDGNVDDGLATATWYDDADGDGFGDAFVSTSSCSAPIGTVADATDCDDTESGVNPAETESKYTVWDDDCSGLAFTGLTLASGVVATSESFIADEADATFDDGISVSWDVISNFLGLTATDMVASSCSWSNTLSGTYDGLEFFGTGGAASQDDECLVYTGELATSSGSMVLSGDRLAVTFDLDSEASNRYGIGVYVGDATEVLTWSALTVESSIASGTDLFEVAVGRAGMDNPDVVICAGGVEYDGEVRFTHVALVTY